MLKKITLIVSFLSVSLLASSGASNEGTDFVPRLINFLIFAGIIYYLIAEHIKNFLNKRTSDISKELERVEDVLRKSKEDKESAQKALEESKELAFEIVKNAKDEAVLLSDKIAKQADNDIENLTKSLEDKKEFSKRKVIRDTVDKVLNDSIDDNAISISEKDIVSLIDKKVA